MFFLHSCFIPLFFHYLITIPFSEILSISKMDISNSYHNQWVVNEAEIQLEFSPIHIRKSEHNISYWLIAYFFYYFSLFFFDVCVWVSGGIFSCSSLKRIWTPTFHVNDIWILYHKWLFFSSATNEKSYMFTLWLSHQ